MLIIPSVTASSAGVATGFLITHTRRLKWPVVTGTSCYLVGTLVLASPLLRPGLETASYLLYLMPSSLGQGFQFPGTFMAVLATSEQAEQAVVTSTLILWRSLGIVLGVSGSSLAVQNALVRYLNRYVGEGGLLDEGERERTIELVRKSVEAVSGLDSVVRTQATRAYRDALSLTFAICAAIAFASLLLIVPTKLPRLGSRKQ